MNAQEELPMYRRILVPLDGSPTAEQALDEATGLAQHAAAQVLLVHVLDFGVSLPCDEDDPDYWRGCRQHDADTYLESVAEKTRVKSMVPVSISVRDGVNTVAAILTEAEDWKANLIVMTTHGRGVIERAWLGSVADSLVREAKLPVLLVRAKAAGTERRGDRRFEHILVPLDDSERSRRILPAAAALARVEQARVTLLHVVHPWVVPVRPLAHAHHAAEIRKHAVLDRTEKAEEYLSEIALGLDPAIKDVTADAVTAKWSDAEEIMNYARDHEADLIALATHGRSGLKRSLLGSVADKIIRGADQPVLVLRPEI
jgi:nucleotide-binding universal stress UspA family protein